MAITKELPVLTPWDDQSALTQDATLERPMSPAQAQKIAVSKKPSWLKVRLPGGSEYQKIKGLLRERKLATVCEEAQCPNIAECWASGTATIMIGTEICTRACRFCAVKTARRPPALDPNEPRHVAETIAALKLRYVVLTSVDRDDLPDGGAEHFAKTIRAIKALDPSIIVEALVPDFKGDPGCVETVIHSGVDVYAHNVETVKRLQYRVRDPRAGYEQSLGTLRYAKTFAEANQIQLYTKSSIMLGLGESEVELMHAFHDLRKIDVDVLTLGQYLRPTKKHLPVEKFYSPDEFETLKSAAEKKGFLYVAAGPMVRSSYRAAELFLKGLVTRGRESDPRRKA